MMRVTVLMFVAVAGLAGQQPPAIGQRPSIARRASIVWRPPVGGRMADTAQTSRPLPADRPERLMAAQQLAMVAYPEVRTRGLQVRVEETSGGTTVTIGFAERDRNDVLAQSRHAQRSWSSRRRSTRRTR